MARRIVVQNEQSSRRQARIKIIEASRSRLEKIAIEMDNREAVGEFHRRQRIRKPANDVLDIFGADEMLYPFQ